MSETTEKTYVFPESGNNSLCTSMMGMLSGLAQKQGVDPATLMAMANNGGFGGNNFMWVIFLFFLMGNGWYGRGGNGLVANTDADTMRLANLINNNDGRSQIMSAVEGNNNAIERIAQSLGCSFGQVNNAINSLSSLIQGVGNQVGMSGQQVINAIQSGDANVVSQMQSCCCNVTNRISESAYENRLAMCQQTNSLTNAINSSAQQIKESTDIRTDAIMMKLDNMEKTALQAKIDALQETKSTLQTQLNLEHQTQNLQAYQAQSLIPITTAISQMQNELTQIRANQLPTTTVPNPQMVGVPSCMAYQAGLIGNFGTGGFWY